MRIDRDLYKSFKEDLFKDKQSYSNLKIMIENQKFEDAEQYFKEKYLNKSYSLDRLREALGLFSKSVVKTFKRFAISIWSTFSEPGKLWESEYMFKPSI